MADLTRDAGLVTSTIAVVGVVKVLIDRTFRSHKDNRDELKEFRESLIMRVDALQEKVVSASIKHAKQMDDLQRIHQREMDDLRDLYNERVDKLENEITAWKEKYSVLEQRHRVLQSDFELTKQRVIELSQDAPGAERPAMQRKSLSGD